MIEVVEVAKKMGLYTIVVDNVIESAAKNYADASYNCNISDMEQLSRIARKENIDGVFNAFDDINTWHALALCKKMNLPFYTASEQFRNHSTNFRFKEYCQSFNVPVIEEGIYERELAKLEFPVRLPNRSPVKKSLQVV